MFKYRTIVLKGRSVVLKWSGLLSWRFLFLLASLLQLGDCRPQGCGPRAPPQGVRAPCTPQGVRAPCSPPRDTGPVLPSPVLPLPPGNGPRAPPSRGAGPVLPSPRGAGPGAPPGSGSCAPLPGVRAPCPLPLSTIKTGVFSLSSQPLAAVHSINP